MEVSASQTAFVKVCIGRPQVFPKLFIWSREIISNSFLFFQASPILVVWLEKKGFSWGFYFLV